MGASRVLRAISRIRARIHFGFWPPPDDGMQTPRRMRFLYDAVLKLAKPVGAALEVGCFKAGSTVYLAKACLKRGVRPISAIDLFTGTPSWQLNVDTEAEARARLKAYGLQDAVTLIRGDAQKMEWRDPLAVFHLDADHEYEAVRADLAKFMPFVVPGGVAILDDYDDAHPGVVRAADDFLVAHPQFKVHARHHEGPKNGSLCMVHRAEVIS